MTDNTKPFSTITTVSLRGFKRGHRPPRVEQTRHGQKTYTHWRVYMDLFHAGDLEHFIKSHKDKDGNNRPIPEAYVWWAFTCLANALVQLESRVQNRNGARAEKDEAIAMIDMKPGNIGEGISIQSIPNLCYLTLVRHTFSTRKIREMSKAIK